MPKVNRMRVGSNLETTPVVEFAERASSMLAAEWGLDEDPARLQGFVTLSAELLRISTQSEEGIFPSFSTAVISDSVLIDLSIEFAELRPVRAIWLRKLAPMIGDAPLALIVRMRDGEPIAEGVARVVPATFSSNHCPQYQVLLSGLLLSIEGPGTLVASNGVSSVALSEMTVSTRSGLASCIGLLEWGEECLSDVLEQDRRLRDLDEQRSDVGETFVRGFLRFWSTVIATVARAGHGGSFLLLPNSVPASLSQGHFEDVYGINIGHPLHPTDLLSWLLNEVRQSFGLGGSSTSSVDHIQEQAECVANLTQVDGAVLVSGDMKVVGFGTMIDQISIPEDKTVLRMTSWSVTEAVREELEAGNFGARHRSALAFCNKHKGAIAIVVSQDGPVRIIATTGDGLSIWGPLSIPRPVSHR